MRWHTEVPALVSNFITYLRRGGRTREDAEDLVQEALLRLEQYCQSGNEVQSAKAFLWRTLNNLQVSEHRQEQPYREGRTSLEAAKLLDPAPRPDDVFLAHQCLKLTQEVLDRVSRRTRDIFFLHRLGGLSHAEIAARYKCSTSLVEKELATAALAITRERLYGTLRSRK